MLRTTDSLTDKKHLYKQVCRGRGQAVAVRRVEAARMLGLAAFILLVRRPKAGEVLVLLMCGTCVHCPLWLPEPAIVPHLEPPREVELC